MASIGSRRLIGAFIAGSMMFSSTAAMASAAPPVQQVNPWAVLTAMSGGAPAAAMCGSTAGSGGCVLPAMAATAAVTQDAPPPPPEPAPPVDAGNGTAVNPLVLALIALAAGVGLILALHHNGSSNSPA